MIELVVSLVGASVLMLGLGSALLIAVSGSDPSLTPAAATRTAHGALSDFLAEIEFAESVTEITPTAMTFVVPDRDADGNPETIRYAWSGTPGEPLTRQLNAGNEAKFVEDVHAFAFDVLVAPNLLNNPDMEAGINDWEAIPGATSNADSSVVYNGVYSVYTQRNSHNDESGIRQDVAAQIVNGTPYVLGAWMRQLAAAPPFGAKVQLHVVSSGSGEQVFASAPVDVNNSNFVWVGGTVTPTWSGSLISAHWEALGVANILHLYVDDARMRTDTSRQHINIRLQVGDDPLASIESGVLLKNRPL